LVNHVINCLVAISASDIGGEAGSRDNSDQIRDIGERNRSKCILDVAKELSDTAVVSSVAKGRKYN
jgi:hypothetical protein